MTTMVRFASKAGGQLEGALCEPPGSGKRDTGAVVVVQEWHGLNDVMKLQCERFAQARFLALVPDLYHGKVAKNDEEAAKLMGALDFQKAVGEIGDAAAYLRSHPRSNGKVAVVGFCLGGALAFAAARYVDGLAAAVPFYGLPQLSIDELSKIKIPIQAHFAKNDDWAKASIAEEIQKKVNAAGGHMELYVYDAGHAFMRSTDPSKYEPNSAKLAWQRTVEFLKQHIG